MGGLREWVLFINHFAIIHSLREVIPAFGEPQWIGMDKNFAARILFFYFCFDFIEYQMGSQQAYLRCHFQVKLDYEVIAAKTGFHVMETADIRMGE
jgi:hypothetical protein